MSMPKDPRQLMINLMYLVLTALLALNVSAEVMSALFMIDESIKETNNLVAAENEQLLMEVTKQADAYPQFKIYQAQAEAVKATADDLNQYIDDLRTELMEAAGGLDEHGLPKRKDDKSITTRLFINEEKGFELEAKVKNTRTDLLGILKEAVDSVRFSTTLPLKINPIPANSDKKNWVEFTFQQMPLAAVLPLLSKFQNDLKVSEERFRVKEVWYFDSHYSVLKVRILGIAPLIEELDEAGNFKYERPLFWAAYNQLRPVLAKERVFNPRNDATHTSWEDLMEMRYFASTIIKASNVHDRKIEDYLIGVDALLEAEKIKQEIFNFEHDLWSY